MNYHEELDQVCDTLQALATLEKLTGFRTFQERLEIINPLTTEERIAVGLELMRRDKGGAR
jgi:hypothetical protein